MPLFCEELSKELANVHDISAADRLPARSKYGRRYPPHNGLAIDCTGTSTLLLYTCTQSSHIHRKVDWDEQGKEASRFHSAFGSKVRFTRLSTLQTDSLVSCSPNDSYNADYRPYSRLWRYLRFTSWPSGITPWFARLC